MSEERFQVKIAGFTDTGLKRQRNQDHIGFDQDLGIAVLADGMGGHQSGEIASQMAVESVLEKLQSICEPKPTKSKTGSQDHKRSQPGARLDRSRLLYGRGSTLGECRTHCH